MKTHETIDVPWTEYLKFLKEVLWDALIVAADSFTIIGIDEIFTIAQVIINRDLTDKPNRNQNRIESQSGKESKGDINIP